MVNINNSSRAYGSNGMLGLATGMDTEAIIESMLSGTQAKIDKHNAFKQQAAWKQDIYRDVISKFHSLQGNYFDLLKPQSNISSPTLFRSKNVKFDSNAIKVTASGSATQIKINEIKQLATGSKVTSNGVASGDIKLNIDATKIKDGASLEFNVDGVKKTITLEGKTNDEILSNLNTELKRSYGSAISVKADGMVEISGKRIVRIDGNSDGLNTIGLTSGKSNKISLMSPLKDLNFAHGLIGDDFKFTINGKEFSFTSEQSLNDVMRTINNSDANVKLSYSTLEDKFVIESTVLGEGVKIDIEETQGNLLSSMFQAGGSGSFTSNNIKYTNNISGQAMNIGDAFKEGSFNIKVNGTMFKFDIKAKANAEDGSEQFYTQDEVLQELNKQMESKFGKDVITLQDNGGSLNVAIKEGIKVEFEADDKSNNSLLGLNNENNVASGLSTLKELNLTGDLKINGVDVILDENATLDQLIAKLAESGVTATYKDGQLSMSATENVKLEGGLVNQIFNTSQVEFNKVGGEFTQVDGQNALLTVNGIAIERSTNNFNIDGFDLVLTDISNEAIDIKAEDNVDAVFDTIVKFVNDYNNLIEGINKLTSEKTDYKNYPPLTDAQKKDMSEKEIELWEEKAKTGLLANDSTLNSILGELRAVLFNKPEGSNISMLDIGIETKNYTDKGKLTIDEAKLKKALQNNMSEVENLFTNQTNGIAIKFNQAMDSAAKSSSATPGRLVVIAGVKNTGSAGNNNLSRQMDNYDKTIANLKRTYDMQKTRYWKQFSSLETVINKMNSQSSWLSQQFG